MNNTTIVNGDFLAAFTGKFTSLLKWKDYDEFWPKFLAQVSDGWFIYKIGEAPPQYPLNASEFTKQCQELIETIRQEHEEDYCGIVYVDDKAHPSFIKIYDPNNLGVVCGIGKQTILPGWTLTKLQPVDLTMLLSEEKPKSLWKKFFG